MVSAILGKKIGMTQIFDADGTRVPVTVIQAGPCVVLQVKCTDGADGYDAVQLGFEHRTGNDVRHVTVRRQHRERFYRVRRLVELHPLNRLVTSRRGLHFEHPGRTGLAPVDDRVQEVRNAPGQHPRVETTEWLRILHGQRQEEDVRIGVRGRVQGFKLS